MRPLAGTTKTGLNINSVLLWTGDLFALKNAFWVFE